jgi:hypothetical protein
MFELRSVIPLSEGSLTLLVPTWSANSCSWGCLSSSSIYTQNSSRCDPRTQQISYSKTGLDQTTDPDPVADVTFATTAPAINSDPNINGATGLSIVITYTIQLALVPLINGKYYSLQEPKLQRYAQTIVNSAVPTEHLRSLASGHTHLVIM